MKMHWISPIMYHVANMSKLATLTLFHHLYWYPLCQSYLGALSFLMQGSNTICFVAAVYV